MQFVLLGYDGDDEGAVGRRLAVRESHLSLAGRLYDEGKWLYAAALLDDDGRMVGSMVVCEFASRAAMDEQWLKEEPYILGNVWQRIEVRRAQVASFCARGQG